VTPAPLQHGIPGKRECHREQATRTKIEGGTLGVCPVGGLAPIDVNHNEPPRSYPPWFPLRDAALCAVVTEGRTTGGVPSFDRYFPVKGIDLSVTVP
jgi:hypothetical protein